jgi:hypothetical protein
MTLSISCRIMDALADLLQGAAPEGESDIPWLVGNPTNRRPQLFLDASRVAGPGDGVVIGLDQGDVNEGRSRDEIADTCRVQSTMPVVLTISMPRQPGDPPNWQLLDPFYVAAHSRIMAPPRSLGGLCQSIQSDGRAFPDPNLQACWLQLLYTVTYNTAKHNVTVSR